ncbi:hypothetical protein H4219_003570 [Mycoemilia scoparia]|uniref:Uncharacterized protein n=1 Tax=Mycoemilia scoparia TaxID=417184 RepID=A0A9W8DP24_9FUNG|nr:hypothetical protein H4219_003570 [Mycoemilia scoparia]
MTSTENIDKELKKCRKIAYKRANGSCCTSKNYHIAAKAYASAAELYAEKEDYENSAAYWLKSAQCYFEENLEHQQASEAFAEAAKMFEKTKIYDAKTKAMIAWARAYQYGVSSNAKPRILNDYIFQQIRLVDDQKLKLKMYKKIKMHLDETGVHTITELEQYYSVVVFMAKFFRNYDASEMHSALNSLKIMLTESEQAEELERYHLYSTILNLYIKDVDRAEIAVQELSKCGMGESAPKAELNLAQDLVSTYKSNDMTAFSQLISSHRICIRNTEIKELAEDMFDDVVDRQPETKGTHADELA